MCVAHRLMYYPSYSILDMGRNARGQACFSLVPGEHIHIPLVYSVSAPVGRGCGELKFLSIPKIEVVVWADWKA